jgi:hypothetical protein
LFVKFGFMVHQDNLGHMALQHERRFQLTLGVTNLKQQQGSKPPHMLELRNAETPVIRTHLVTSYNHTVINSGCNSNASTLKGNPSAILTL